MESGGSGCVGRQLNYFTILKNEVGKIFKCHVPDEKNPVHGIFNILNLKNQEEFLFDEELIDKFFE